MRTFPENKYEDDVIGRGTTTDLLAEITRRGSQYVEIRTLADETHGYRSGTFGQFQHRSGDKVSMSVRFMGDGEGGGLESDVLCRTTLEVETPIEWVIHTDPEFSARK